MKNELFASFIRLSVGGGEIDSGVRRRVNSPPTCLWKTVMDIGPTAVWRTHNYVTYLPM